MIFSRCFVVKAAFHDGLKAVGLVVLLALAASCSGRRSGGNDPKGRLQDYISMSFSVGDVSDRDALGRFLVGPAKIRLAAWSDDQFRAAFLNNKRQFVKLVFSEVRNLSPEQVNVTYELTFLDQTKGYDAKVTQKKMAQLVLQKDQWLISEVRNLKELIEYKNEMSLP